MNITKRVDNTESGAVRLPTKGGLHDAGWESLDVSEKGRCSTSRLYGRGAGMESHMMIHADSYRAPQPPQDDYRVGLTAPPRDTRPQTEVCQLSASLERS